jgi:hypothetical protein
VLIHDIKNLFYDTEISAKRSFSLADNKTRKSTIGSLEMPAYPPTLLFSDQQHGEWNHNTIVYGELKLVKASRNHLLNG